MKDQLSALMDNELDVEGADHILTAVKSGGELQQTWHAYHLIGDTMRGDLHTRVNLTDRVLAALEDEPTVVVARKPTRNFKASALWSMAASVAAVMFVGLVVLQQFGANEEMAPIEIAQSVPMEYLEAHHAAAPSGLTHFIQTANYSEQQQ